MEPVHLASAGSHEIGENTVWLMCWPLFLCLARSLSKLAENKE